LGTAVAEDIISNPTKIAPHVVIIIFFIFFPHILNRFMIYKFIYIVFE
jgi:hypothetical protein